MVSLFGSRDELLKLIEEGFNTSILVRGNEITITGDPAEAERVAHLFEELIQLLDQGHVLTADSVGRSIDMVKGGTGRPSKVLSDAVLTTRAKSIRPKTVGQSRYIDAIRNNTIVFGIGPAGTGKTYLAVASAIHALQEKLVRRIVLTRPAVEAGERLGFLPGDIAAKVDPYLKPLYDALYEMLEPEAYDRAMERGTIEVAPLAFMRGRAQPLASRVLTPSGWRDIGALEVGDFVVGSDGMPTQVLGVYPQGRKQVFRLTATDGSSTLCCAEHLWAVYTASDKRRNKPARVLETRQMMGQLRSFHQHRFELPILSAPVNCPAKDVPLDPYALGLLLGDGCITGTTTPSFTSEDPELVAAVGVALPHLEMVPKGDLNYVVRHVKGGRGGLRIPNPLTVTLRELELCGTRSSTKFIPADYLYNSPAVRVALLQGLLDTDGGPVLQEGRSARIGYVTTSARLRDDVIFLVRSLGGVVYWRTRRAEGRKPGRANGRDVPYRSDAYALDIRLPAAIPPFRLGRKAKRYASSGGGRPMRFIDRIDPAGEEETVCIRVAASDSLYITDDFLLTHNSLNDSFIILDEAQNTTAEQMKMFLTRLGFGSRAVVTGDITQIDLPQGQKSGLVLVQEILKDIKGVAFSYLHSEDVVRHKIVMQIVEAYRRFAERPMPEVEASNPPVHS